MSLRNRLSSRELAAMGVFTAFVAVATMVVSANVAATGGYFNIGETMVYTAALLMGPVVGAFAGGIGSMISDVALGYAVFAPGTLVIKGAEGFIVGYLAQYRFNSPSKTRVTVLAVISGMILALVIWWGGTSFFTGDIDFTLGIAPSTLIFTLAVPELFWIVLAVAAFLLVTIAGVYLDPQISWLVFVILLGGAEMVVGYYFYERYVMGQVLATAEILVNIGQVIVGLIVSIPLTRSIARIMPRNLKRQPTSAVQTE
ncbi:MAG: ECF transporter S component [Thaumarchaeota archaeon]|nr:ECF transporter S component [Nitrososphaerota archaeon]MCL5316650.1 ECF transporter S component [Nitrososphaerota archaeon]